MLAVLCRFSWIQEVYSEGGDPTFNNGTPSRFDVPNRTVNEESNTAVMTVSRLVMYGRETMYSPIYSRRGIPRVIHPPRYHLWAIHPPPVPPLGDLGESL